MADTDPLDDVLRSSVARLRALVTPLDDDQLQAAAYPAEWTIADVLSHLGSAAVIQQRRLDDALAAQPTPDDFAPSVWDTWNAKSPRQMADDALVADQALIDRLDSLTDAERAGFRFALGPLTFDLAGFIGLRVNEHTLHTWDVEVALDPTAVVASDAVAVVVDQLELIARYTAKPTSAERTITVHTTEPSRRFTVDLAADGVTFTPGDTTRPPDLALPSEALIRLVYGRLDLQHTPDVDGDPEMLEVLRRVFPGP